MTCSCGCSGATGQRKLVREGTNQVQRALAAPDPARMPVDERRPEHAMVFAAAYASYLTYFGPDGKADKTWEEFFATDVSAQLAVAAIEDVSVYRTALDEWQRELEDPELPADGTKMAGALGAVFGSVGTLAFQLDRLKEALTSDARRHGAGPGTGEARHAATALGATLGNLVRARLSPMLRRLIGYHSAGEKLSIIDSAVGPPGGLLILGRPVQPFVSLLNGDPLSDDWATGADVAGWADYIDVAPEPYQGAYGTGSKVARINHLATHNLFTAACDAFLGVYARVVEDAREAVAATFEWNGHEPHYALFLAFLKLLEHARAEANTITARHFDFYYRDVLRLKERPARPGQAHVLVELAKHVPAHLVAAGTLLKAGKDDTGADAHFAVDRDLVANKATVAELRSLYRHRNTEAESLEFDDGRIFASPVANSDDGLGAKLTTPDQSWHPFADKVYQDGALKALHMPPAEVGFAIASHYLWMAEGKRTVEVTIERFGFAPQESGTIDLTGTEITIDADLDPVVFENVDLTCHLTTEKGWIEKPVTMVGVTPTGLGFEFVVSAGDPPITPYNPETHGYTFDTSMPVLVVKLRHRAGTPWASAFLGGVTVRKVSLTVKVDALRTFTAGNDVGPVDISKPFQAFGPAPVTKSALVIGSKEAFQKQPSLVRLKVDWMSQPTVTTGSVPDFVVDSLNAGVWTQVGTQAHTFKATDHTLTNLSLPPVDEPDLTADEAYRTASRGGFIRLRLAGGFGVSDYPLALTNAIVSKSPLPSPPVVPTLSSLDIYYEATQLIDLITPHSEGLPASRGRFFHVTPFGHAEQFPSRTGQPTVTVLPRFIAGNDPAEAELYIGVRGLRPPQNLALLFQVADGTANPLVVKPEEHIRWSYLHGNEWVPFAADAVGDGTDGLLASGIVTLAVPADASTEHTLLPPGMHWIRLAVASASDAVCRLVTVAAQALQATYVVRDNGAESHTRELPPGTITKLDPPDASVKGIGQPFPTFGGRPVESPVAFAARAGERLRHKDRAIAQWDYEHLILEAFPGIYQARCLNHTRYEPCDKGTGMYRELAPGHVTVVTIPDLAVPNPRDPLRPYTSLRVLGEIERFLTGRMSCFAKLHVRNPQFEEVRVDLRVRFRETVDETFHRNRLKREITEFLSPWAFRDDARPTFDGTIEKSMLVNFIEERPYVDYVSAVKLFRKDPGGYGPDVDEVVGSRSISILVSVPADQHDIAVIHPEDVPVPEHCACGPEVG